MAVSPMRSSIRSWSVSFPAGQEGLRLNRSANLLPSNHLFPAARRSNPLMFAGIGVAAMIFLGVVFAMNRPDASVETPEPEHNASIPTDAPVAEPPSEAAPNDAIPPTEVSPSDEFTDANGVTMVFVPAGNFIVGSDSGYDDEKPVHTVYLDDFYIDKFEVTNVLYRACVDAGTCQPPNSTGSFIFQRAFSHSAMAGGRSACTLPLTYMPMCPTG
jgi:formylglycine-generating enzyme required for sulfatase activity